LLIGVIIFLFYYYWLKRAAFGIDIELTDLCNVVDDWNSDIPYALILFTFGLILLNLNVLRSVLLLFGFVLCAVVKFSFLRIL